jgi:8-oxo-dGTP pyrophosphatase MutT (NUDIX family)
MIESQPLQLEQIRLTLARHTPQILPADRGHAAVSMILRDTAPDPELLFILRAPCQEDPWSGDIGFPGGRLNRDETDPRQAAERETDEELSLDLGQAEHLGRLDDLYGATLPVLVSCYVYAFRETPQLQPNHEIAETFWVPLNELLNPARHHQACLVYRGQTIAAPAVDLIGLDSTVLWGITYRLIGSFFDMLGHPFGNNLLNSCREQKLR